MSPASIQSYLRLVVLFHALRGCSCPAWKSSSKISSCHRSRRRQPVGLEDAHVSVHMIHISHTRYMIHMIHMNGFTHSIVLFSVSRKILCLTGYQWSLAPAFSMSLTVISGTCRSAVCGSASMSWTLSPKFRRKNGWQSEMRFVTSTSTGGSQAGIQKLDCM